MKTRKHVHDEEFTVTVEELFSILITPSSIRQWWGAARAIVLPERNGNWAAAWGNNEDDPDYITVANICVFQPPHRMVLDTYRYHSKSGPLPFDADFQTEFAVFPSENGVTLQVTQDGFPAGPEADEFYSACQSGWQATFASIRQFLDRPIDGTST